MGDDSHDDARDRDDRPWRPSASGASFVYVFPRPGEDLLKLGMSRDPLARIQALHPRWYGFFDLDAGWMVEVDRVREARALELRLSRSLAGHGAPAPLTARADAGGSSEWYRGATDRLETQAQELARTGLRMHRPLRPWFRHALAEQSRLLFHWSESMLQGLLDDPPAAGPPSPLEWALRNALDAPPALGIALAPLVSPRVLAWHEDSFARF
jgi:hypothetical protein